MRPLVQYPGLLDVHYLARDNAPGALVDAGGEALLRLGLRSAADAAQYVVRPDGYIGARCAGRDLGFVTRYLARWTVATTALSR